MPIGVSPGSDLDGVGLLPLPPVLRPHQIAYAHTHPDSEEWVTVLGGNGQARFGTEEPLSLNPGMIVGRAERHPHGFLSGPEPRTFADQLHLPIAGGLTAHELALARSTNLPLDLASNVLDSALGLVYGIPSLENSDYFVAFRTALLADPATLFALPSACLAVPAIKQLPARSTVSPVFSIAQTVRLSESSRADAAPT